MVQATVNDKKFEVQGDGKSVLIDQQPLAWDVLKISERHFHILLENKTYRAELIKSDHETKTFSLKINGRLYTVNLKDKFD